MIRPIRAGDSEAVCEVLQHALIDGGHTTRERIVAGSTDPLFVGLVQESPSGIVGVVIGQVAAGEAEIHEVAVAHPHRREGSGSALVQAFEAEAYRRGASTCFLEVRPTNTAAVELYNSLGFEACGERKGYYRDGADALVMRHSLRDES